MLKTFDRNPDGAHRLIETKSGRVRGHLPGGQMLGFSDDETRAVLLDEKNKQVQIWQLPEP